MVRKVVKYFHTMVVILLWRIVGLFEEQWPLVDPLLALILDLTVKFQKSEEITHDKGNLSSSSHSLGL